MNHESSLTDSGTPPKGDSTFESEYRVIDGYRFISALWVKRYFIAACAFLGLVVGAVSVFFIKPQYDSVARLQPPVQREVGLLSLMPTRNQGDLYLGFLMSRTVADDVIEHQHLKEYFHSTRPSELRRRLQAMSTIKTDKDQFLTVTVRAAEPETARRIANEYVDALYRLSHSMALAEAEHRWEYFEGPLEQEKDKLADAEDALKQVQQATGMVLPEAQVRAGVNALAQLRQEIAIREVQLAALRAGNTDANPQVIQLKSQLANLHAQIDRMRKETGGSFDQADVKKNLPELTLQVERKMREVKYHEALFGILSRQYENARVDQSYTPPIEVVDRPVIADEKSWPPRKLFALCGLLVGGLFGSVFVCFEALDLKRRIVNFLNTIELSTRVEDPTDQ